SYDVQAEALLLIGPQRSVIFQPKLCNFRKSGFCFFKFTFKAINPKLKNFFFIINFNRLIQLSAQVEMSFRNNLDIPVRLIFQSQLNIFNYFLYTGYTSFDVIQLLVYSADFTSDIIQFLVYSADFTSDIIQFLLHSIYFAFDTIQFLSNAAKFFFNTFEPIFDWMKCFFYNSTDLFKIFWF